MRDRIRPDNSTLLVIDVQDKLLAKMPGAAVLVRNVGFLLDAAALLGVTVAATEQYPKGLGPTTPEIARRLPAPPAAKSAFSAADAVPINTPVVVLVGMESHVCVAQTARDLLAAGRRVLLPVDAVAARFPLDHDTALRSLEGAGAELTTVEAVAFEWVGDATDPRFKAMSRLVIERAAAAG